MKNFCLAIKISILCLAAISKAQTPIVEYVSAKLPFSNFCHRLHYDGDDSIFIIGGCYSETDRKVLKYSLQNDAIKQMTTLPTHFSHGSIQMDPQGKLLLFSGRDNVQDRKHSVIKYDIQRNKTEIVATFKEEDIIVALIVQSCSGNETDKIRIIDLDLHSQIRSFPFVGKKLAPKFYKVLTLETGSYNISKETTKLKSPIVLDGAATICVNGRNFVFPFKNYGNGSVWEFNSDFSELFRVGQQNLPNLSPYPSLASDGVSIFVIAGFDKKEAKNHEGIIRFDTRTDSSHFIPIKNWPVKNGERFFYLPPQCVFVQKLGRIYCFGGMSWDFKEKNATQHNEIFYLDMRR